MTKIRAWDGIGVAANTQVSTSTVGTGDTAFTVALATPFWNSSGALPYIACSNTAETDQVGWGSLGSLTNWTVTAWMYFDTSLASVIKPICRLDSGTGSTLMGYVGVNSSGQFTLRNASDALVGTSTTPAVNTPYQVIVYGNTTSSTVHVRVYNALTNVIFWTADLNIGVTTALNYVTWGRQDATPIGTVLRMAHFGVYNTDADPGPYVAPSTSSAASPVGFRTYMVGGGKKYLYVPVT